MPYMVSSLVWCAIALVIEICTEFGEFIRTKRANTINFSIYKRWVNELLEGWTLTLVFMTF